MLSGQADVSNLFTALEEADFDENNSLEKVKEDFANGTRGVTSFTYNEITEGLRNQTEMDYSALLVQMKEARNCFLEQA